MVVRDFDLEVMCYDNTNRYLKPSRFNEAFYERHRNKYNVTFVDNTKYGAWPGAFVVPDIVVDLLKNGIAIELYNDAVRRDCFILGCNEETRRCTKMHHYLVIIDIDDAKLSSKCKLLGLETKYVLCASIILECDIYCERVKRRLCVLSDIGSVDTNI